MGPKVHFLGVQHPSKNSGYTVTALSLAKKQKTKKKKQNKTKQNKQKKKTPTTTNKQMKDFIYFTFQELKCHVSIVFLHN